MTLESALLTALTGVVGALVFVSKLLWTRSEQCEKDRIEIREKAENLRQEIAGLREVMGHSRGRIEAYERCPLDQCPFNKAA